MLYTVTIIVDIDAEDETEAFEKLDACDFQVLPPGEDNIFQEWVELESYIG